MQSNPFGVKTNALLQKYVNELKCFKSALDIGCANGSNALYLKELGIDVTAIDKIIPKTFFDTDIHIKQVDIRDFHFKKYDVIAAFNVLQFIDKDSQVIILDRIYNALNKNGMLFISSFTQKDPSYPNSKSIIGHFAENELKKWAINKNLSILEYEEIIKDDDHEPLGPHVHGVVRIVLKKNF